MKKLALRRAGPSALRACAPLAMWLAAASAAAQSPPAAQPPAATPAPAPPIAPPPAAAPNVPPRAAAPRAAAPSAAPTQNPAAAPNLAPGTPETPAPAAAPESAAQTAPSSVPVPAPVAPSATLPAAEATAPSPTTPTDSAPAADASVSSAALDPAPSDAAEAALASLQAELSAGQDAAVDAVTASPINIYGFADFTYQQPLHDVFLTGELGAFYIGNMNVYLASELGNGWRALTEVRFTYLPHGSTSFAGRFGGEERTDSTYPDYVDLGRPMRVGGIELERAYIEYEVHPNLTLRVGQFLSPYGVWNVDHGSPVFIGVVRPYVVGQELIPERQTGFEAYGSTYIDATKLGYHLTLSNGRGPIDAYRDLDANKAIGGRLYVRNDSLLGTLQLGTSFYVGRYTDRGPQTLVITPDGNFQSSEPVTTQYDELSLAADLKWELGDFLLQSEFAFQQVAFVGDARPLTPFAPTPALAADHYNLGSYLVLAYHLPFNLTPFVTFEHLYQGLQSNLRDVVSILPGINFRPMANVVLKAQYTLARFPGSDLRAFGNTANIDILSFQIAWSF